MRTDNWPFVVVAVLEVLCLRFYANRNHSYASDFSNVTTATYQDLFTWNLLWYLGLRDARKLVEYRNFRLAIISLASCVNLHPTMMLTISVMLLLQLGGFTITVKTMPASMTTPTFTIKWAKRSNFLFTTQVFQNWGLLLRLNSIGSYPVNVHWLQWLFCLDAVAGGLQVLSPCCWIHN